MEYKISIAIPCWSMNGVGSSVLKHSLDIIERQTLKDFQIVITDHSQDDNILELCMLYDMDIKYLRNKNDIGNPAANTNYGLKNCDGYYIKLLCQDDYLLNEDSLRQCYDNIKNSNACWAFNSYFHTFDKVNLLNPHYPHFNNDVQLNNTLGTPSALIIKNGLDIYFDTNLKYMYDCEFYKRMYNKHGQPNIEHVHTMVNYKHENQTTNTIATEELRMREIDYVRRKHFC